MFAEGVLRKGKRRAKKGWNYCEPKQTKKSKRRKETKRNEKIRKFCSASRFPFLYRVINMRTA